MDYAYEVWKLTRNGLQFCREGNKALDRELIESYVFYQDAQNRRDYENQGNLDHNTYYSILKIPTYIEVI